MFKNLLFSFVGLLLLAGCQKVDLSEYLGEKGDGYELTFSIGKYQITDARSQKPASELGTVLNLMVFRGDEKVKTVNQKAGDENFGTVKVTLPQGQYTVLALVHSGSGNASGSSVEKITFPNNKVTDTFSCLTEVDVTKNESVELLLDRVVAKFRFTVVDAIPAEVEKMQFYYTGGSSTLNAATGFGCVNSRQTEIRDVTDHSAGQVFEVYTFPHDMVGELTMTITAIDDNGAEYAVQTLNNVPVEYQKVTNSSMVFFGNSSSSPGSQVLSLYGDDGWKGEINY